MTIIMVVVMMMMVVVTMIMIVIMMVMKMKIVMVTIMMVVVTMMMIMMVMKMTITVVAMMMTIMIMMLMMMTMMVMMTTTNFQIGAGLYAFGRPVQKKERRGRPFRHQSIPAPRERGLIQLFFWLAGQWTPSCGWRGFWPYRVMSRRIPDRQPRLGLATCVRQK